PLPWAGPGPGCPAGAGHLPELAAATLPRSQPAQLRAGPGAGRGAPRADVRSPAGGRGYPPPPGPGRPAAATAPVTVMRPSEGLTPPPSSEQQRVREQALLTENELLRRTLVRCSKAASDRAPAIELCLQ